MSVVPGPAAPPAGPAPTGTAAAALHPGWPRTAEGLALAIRQRELSAVEVTRRCLDAIRARNPAVHAFADVAERRALRAAAAADAQVARGELPLPLFLGIPTGVKDNDHVRGHFTRVGSRALAWVYAPADGLVARTLRTAGFTLLGKLTTSELTILPIVDTALGAVARNPVAPDHYSGGSSGGSAAAVAAGMIPIAPGSDGAGSIRIPAAFCGLVGWKPGRGAVPEPYAAFDRPRVSAIGPIARTVRDAALMLDALTGRPYRPRQPAPGSYAAALAPPAPGLRIRVVRRAPLPGVEVDPEIDAAVMRAAGALAALGHHVDEGAPLAGDVAEFLPIMARMVANVPIPPGLGRLLEPSTRWLRELGRGSTVETAQAAADALARRVLTWFGDVDAVVSPTVACPAPRVGAYAHLRDGAAVFHAMAPLGAFTAAFNVSGQPAVSLPVGATRAGLPIGVQLVGRRHGDHRLLGLAAALEAALA